jgi:hypothetical protein
LVSLLLVHHSRDVRHAAQLAVACMVKQHYAVVAPLAQQDRLLGTGKGSDEMQQGAEAPTRDGGDETLLIRSLCNGLTWVMSSNQWASTLLVRNVDSDDDILFACRCSSS